MIQVDPFVIQQAEIRASQLVASSGFTKDDWEDLRQDLLLDYLERLPLFDSRRGAPRGFVFGIVRNRAARLARQQNRHTFVGQATDSEEIESNSSRGGSIVAGLDLLELRIDVRKVVAALPEHLRELATLLGMMPVAGVREMTGRSRPRIYQMIGEIRQAFEEAGLAPNGGRR